MSNQLNIGDKIHCRSWKDLQNTALQLSSEGYGISVIGFSDMSDDILTITALPEGNREVAINNSHTRKESMKHE